MTYKQTMPRLGSANKEKKKMVKSFYDKKIGITSSSERKSAKMNNFVK